MDGVDSGARSDAEDPVETRFIAIGIVCYIGLIMWFILATLSVIPVTVAGKT